MTARALVAGILLLTGVPTARGQDAREQELEALRLAIDQRRQRIEVFEREQKGLFDALEAIDQAVAAALEIAAHREREASEAAAAALALEAQLPDLEAQLERTRTAMSMRVVALYKTGELGPAQLVFASQSLRELLDRIDVLGRLLAHDRLLYARFRAEQQALDSARAEAGAAVQRRDEARAQLGERHAQAEQERAAKHTLLAAVKSDRARERAALDELEAAARALEDKIASLGSEEAPVPAAPLVPFATLRGQLPAPVDAAVVQRFGREVDAEFHTQVFHKGIDFGATLGTPVRAVAAGTVRFAGWFRGYGRMVILDHGDRFYTVSGHLDALRVATGKFGRGGRTDRNGRRHGLPQRTPALLRDPRGLRGRRSARLARARHGAGASTVRPPRPFRGSRLDSAPMRNPSLRTVAAFLCGAAASLAFLAVTRPSDVTAARYEDLSLFTSVMHLVRRNYVEEVDETDLIRGAVRGMLAELDPHSTYMDPDAHKEMQIDTKGEFHGLGIEISKRRDGYIEVVSPIDGTPASRAGVRARDQIVAICPTDRPADWTEDCKGDQEHDALRCRQADAWQARYRDHDPDLPRGLRPPAALHDHARRGEGGIGRRQGAGAGLWLHPPALVPGAHRARSREDDREGAQAGRRHAARPRARPARQPGRIARPGRARRRRLGAATA